MNELLQKTELYIDDKRAAYTDVKRYLDEAAECGLRAVTLPPSFIGWARKYVGTKMKICSFAGYPAGNDTITTKAQCIREGLKKGAEEFLAAVNYNEIKSGNAEYTLFELKRLKRECRSKLFKCLIEPELLTSGEIENFCRFALQSRCDYIALGCPHGSKTADFDQIENAFSKIKSLVGKKIKLSVFCPEPLEERIASLFSLGADRVCFTPDFFAMIGV